MRKRASFIVTAAVALTVVFMVGNRLTSVQGQAQASRPAWRRCRAKRAARTCTAATRSSAGWPKPLSSVPGVGKWTWGAGQGVFAESPNRVFVLAARHAAGDRASEDGQDRAERRVPDRPPAVARRHVRQPSRSAVQAGHRRNRATISTPASRTSTTSGARIINVDRRAGQPHRGLDAVRQDVPPAALGLREPVRSAEGRLDRRRLSPRDLPVQQRRQEAAADDRHAERARHRRDAFLPPDVHGVGARTATSTSPTATRTPAS